MPFLLALIASFVPLVAAAQVPADTVVAGGLPVASFEDARAVAADPFGNLYVPDAGRGVVRIFSPGGADEVLGGPGGAQGEFDAPADVDPTNGLVLLVADAGNGRIQRFSRARAFLGALSVPSGGLASSAPGRPTAVAVSPAGELFAVDEVRNEVLRWDRSLRLAGTVGATNAGPGALVEPVALAVDAERRLYVADRGQAAVLVYDAFGVYVRRLAPGLAGDVRALFIRDGRLWIVLPERLLVYGTHGGLERVVDVKLPQPLVDAEVVGGALYLLTSTHLFHTAYRP